MPHRPVVIVETPDDWVVVPVTCYLAGSVAEAVATALGLRPGVVRVTDGSRGFVATCDVGRPEPLRVPVKRGRLAAPAPAAGTPAGG